MGTISVASFALSVVAHIATNGGSFKVLGIRVSVGTVNFSFLVTTFSSAIWFFSRSLIFSLKRVFLFSLILTSIIVVLKFYQFDSFINTGFDLGIMANILYNIFAYHEVWDSLNWTHGFSGHFWPMAYPLSYLYHLWLSPKVLLVTQTVALGATPVIIAILLKRNRIDDRTSWLLLWLWSVNFYFHRMSGFDFHPETIATPLFLLALLLIDRKQKVWAVLLLLLAMTTKEDVAIGVASIGAYYVLFDRKNRGMGLFLTVIGAAYFLTAVLIISQYGKLMTQINTNYGKGPFLSFAKLGVTVRFLFSLGFLPLLVPEKLVMIAFPFLEHILNSRRLHYSLYGQYVAVILPISIYISIQALKKLKDPLLWLFLGIFYSSLTFPYGAYITPLAANKQKRAYLDRTLGSIPSDMPVAAGNHITPHLALRRNTYQIPTLRDAQLIIIDTTWHDYTPMSTEEGQVFLRRLINSDEWTTVSDSFGVLILRRKRAQDTASVEISR